MSDVADPITGQCEDDSGSACFSFRPERVTSDRVTRKRPSSEDDLDELRAFKMDGSLLTVFPD